MLGFQKPVDEVFFRPLITCSTSVSLTGTTNIVSEQFFVWNIKCFWGWW